jgi:hypothetical protein
VVSRLREYTPRGSVQHLYVYMGNGPLSVCKTLPDIEGQMQLGCPGYLEDLTEVPMALCIALPLPPGKPIDPFPQQVNLMRNKLTSESQLPPFSRQVTLMRTKFILTFEAFQDL